MPSDSINRQAWREQLASLIDAAFDADWDVYEYGTVNFNGKARNITIASGDADYPELGADSNEVSTGDAEIDLYIAVYILYADDDLSWTAKNSQDALDLGRKKIADVLRSNYKVSSYWDKLIPSRSRVDVMPDIAGKPYRFELIPVRLTKYA